MNQNQVEGSERKSKKIEAVGHDAAEGLRHRVEHVRDIVENVREKAEVAFRDRPYLVPLTAGAVGFGVGVLFGSKITRFILFTAVGTVLSDVFGGEIKRLAAELSSELQNRLGEGEGGDGGAEAIAEE